jgi:hypothetical protein
VENYLKLKVKTPSNTMELVISTFIQEARRLNKPLWILSYKRKINNKVWFYGIQCLPNHLLQEMMWCEQVIPNNHFIIDLSDCQNTIMLHGSIKCVVNPSKLIYA